MTVKLDYIDCENMDIRHDTQTVNKVYSLVETAIRKRIKRIFDLSKRLSTHILFV